MNMTYRELAFAVAFGALISAGCTGAKGRIDAPELDAAKMAADAMALCDANGDGFIDKTEVKTSPALNFALDDIDVDGDKKISEDELNERFKIYEDTAVGLQSVQMFIVKRNGEGIEGATVRLVPEPFMEDYIEVAEGEVLDLEGMVQIMTLPPDPGVRVGMYRLEVTSDDFKIPSKYNEDTKWGIEVPPITSKATSQPLRFVVK